MRLVVNILTLMSLANLFFIAGCGLNDHKQISHSSPVSVGGLMGDTLKNKDLRFDVVDRTVGTLGEIREVVKFSANNLEQYALVLKPAGDPPKSGWPVLMFNHGYHPAPADYGIFPDGKESRPGAYYWRIPQAFVQQGYMVVAPDYRGHNKSQGKEYTQSEFASHWYSLDVIACYFAMMELPSINAEQVYMLGHSMGGGVTQRALLVLGNRIKAASIWSISGDGLWRQQFNLPFEKDHVINTAIPTDTSALQQIQRLQTPLAIHHAVDDKTASIQWALGLVDNLAKTDKQYQFFTYPSDEHLFTKGHFKQAINRDINLFTRHATMGPNQQQ